MRPADTCTSRIFCSFLTVICDGGAGMSATGSHAQLGSGGWSPAGIGVWVTYTTVDTVHVDIGSMHQWPVTACFLKAPDLDRHDRTAARAAA